MTAGIDGNEQVRYLAWKAIHVAEEGGLGLCVFCRFSMRWQDDVNQKVTHAEHCTIGKLRAALTREKVA